MADEKLRFVGISTSPRAGGSTERLAGVALDAAVSFALRHGYAAETDLISLSGKRISPCNACMACSRNGTYCILKDDWRREIDRLINPVPDGLVFAVPVYFGNQNALARAFIERCHCLVARWWSPDFPYEVPDFSRTGAGALAVGGDRNGGQEPTIFTTLQWFFHMGFVAVGGHPNIGAAGWSGEREDPDGIKDDVLGRESASLLGAKVSKLAILLREGSRVVSLPQLDKRNMDYPFSWGVSPGDRFW